MSRREETLGLQKRVLQARSALYRLKMRHEALALRESLSWPRAVGAVARSPAGKAAGFDLAIEALGPGRMARLLAFASRVLMGVRIAGIALELLKARPTAATEKEAAGPS